MNKTLLLLILYLFPSLAFAKSEIPPLAQYFISHVKWYTKDAKGHKATMLTLDYPYTDPVHPKDYFTFSLLKHYGKKRPRLFAIILGNTVDPSRGLSLYFFKQLNPKKLDDVQPTASITDITPIKDDNKFVAFLFKDMRYHGQDLFQHFMNKDALIAVFYDKNGTKNRLLMSYATGTFPKAYRQLK